MKIGDEIRQRKFVNEYHKTHINVLFTASWLNKRVTKTLKPYSISRQQFNILRILRGQHPNPGNVKMISERMIDKMSNASRIVDKLEKKGLVTRIRVLSAQNAQNVKLLP
ncbi:MAG: MarR family transcriptional regulator [Bacteroidota bacterium]